MFGWFKRTPRQPTRTEMGGRVASTLNAFIKTQGFEEFSKNRLSLIITEDFKVSISDGRFLPNGKPIVSVPLNEMHLIVPGTAGMMLPMGIDAEVHLVVDRLPPQSN